MGICTRCHSQKSIWAPRCHACNEYTSFAERLFGNLFIWIGVPVVWFICVWLIFAVLIPALASM